MSPDAGRFELGVSRFGGLWGNPNTAGYVCLVVTVLSIFAKPMIGWIGRLGCLPVLYLSASRKSVILYILICITYMVIVQRRNLKAWVGLTAVAVILAISFSLSMGLQNTSRLATRNPLISRLMDVKESEMSAGGRITRVDLFEEWVGKLNGEPWYGYGFMAMSGSFIDPQGPASVVHRGLLPYGTHNTYLGILIDTGPVGLIALLAMLLYYAKACLSFAGPPIVRWALVSFLLCNLVIMFVSHSHLFSFEGQCTFLLFFLLPSCAGLREYARWQAQPGRAGHLAYFATPFPR